MIETELEYTGIRYARDSVEYLFSLPIYQKVNSDTGVKFDWILQPENYPTQLQYIQANTNLLAEVEGPNEVDNWPITYNGQTGQAAAAAFQQKIYTDIKGSPATSFLPVDSLTVANADFTGLGNLAAYCNYSSSHIYTQYGGTYPISLDMCSWIATNNDRSRSEEPWPVITGV